MLSISVVEPALIRIPSGDFILGSTQEQIDGVSKRFPDIDKRLLERELPQHTVHLSEYYIGKYPVTNKQFSVFIQDSQYITTAEKEGGGAVFIPDYTLVRGADWKHPHGPQSDISAKDNHPAVQVSWYDAVAYCKWLSVKINKKYRLPTEAEWEKAARGVDGRLFPWGNNWDQDICNTEYKIKDTTPVDRFSPTSDSPYGCADMCGNVFQWVSTTIGSIEPWPSKYVYPYNLLDGRENMNTGGRRIGRGGSYSRGEAYCRTTFRFADLPTDRYSTQGFRIVLIS